MKPPTVDMLRTYLMTASLAFVFIVTLAPAALAVFGTSDEIFQTPALRDGAIAAAIYLVLLTKTAAKLAFHTASTNRHTPPYRPTASQLFRFNAWNWEFFKQAQAVRSNMIHRSNSNRVRDIRRVIDPDPDASRAIATGWQVRF
jgi:hypothetical protein